MKREFEKMRLQGDEVKRKLFVLFLSSLTVTADKARIACFYINGNKLTTRKNRCYVKGKVSWEKRRISVVISIYSFAVLVLRILPIIMTEFLNLFGYAFYFIHCLF